MTIRILSNVFVVVVLSGVVSGQVQPAPGAQPAPAASPIVMQRPVDKQVSYPALALYNLLLNQRGKGIMFGHQDSLAYGMGWKGGDFDSDVFRVTGDYPAVFGWDLGHIGDKNNIDGVPFDNMKQWMIKVYQKHGINTASWHEVHPAGGGGTAWTTTPVVKRLLEGGDLHAAFLKRLDLLADFFLSLKADDGELGPVILRLYHEQTGDWFWWGTKSCTAEEYKQLWQMTVRHLRDTRGVHNLLYCFSPADYTTAQDYLSTWPGDEFVDIPAMDDYDSLVDAKKRSRAVAKLETLVTLADEKGKPAAISETGLERIPQAKWWTETLLPAIKSSDKTKRLTWVLVWRNGRPDHYYAPYPGQASADDFKAFQADPYTLFLSEMPDFHHPSEKAR